MNSNYYLPLDNVRIFLPYPSRQHPAIGAPKGDHGAVPGPIPLPFEPVEELGKVRQSLL